MEIQARWLSCIKLNMRYMLVVCLGLTFSKENVFGRPTVKYKKINRLLYCSNCGVNIKLAMLCKEV